MKKTLILVMALCAATFFANAQNWNKQLLFEMEGEKNVTTSILPTPAVEVIKFHKIADVNVHFVVQQNTGGIAYLRSKVTGDTTSVIYFMGPITEVIGTTFSDTLIVPDTLTSYVKVYAFADSLGTMPIDSTPYVLMTYDMKISSYTVTPIVGGYISVATINTGNTRCSIQKQLSIYPDTTFQFPFPYRTDTVFGVGVTLTLRDTVNNLTSPQTPLAFCDRLIVHQLLSWGIQVLDTNDCNTTLIAGAAPTANWYGSVSATSTSASYAVVTDGFGQAGDLEIFIKEQATGMVIDSNFSTTTTTPGAQINNGSFQPLTPVTTYELYGTYTTSLGTVTLPLVTFTTGSAPLTLTNIISNVVVGNDVKITFSYTVPAGNTGNFTCGYGQNVTTLTYSSSTANLANNGTMTESFVLPGATGWYIAQVYGYNEQTFDLSVIDTVHFYVNSLTGIEDVMSSESGIAVSSLGGQQVEIKCSKQDNEWIVVDLMGRNTKKSKGSQTLTLATGAYFLITAEGDSIKFTVE